MPYGSRRSSRFHNAARVLFSSYVAPLLSRRLASPFSRSSVGQRTFSPAAFQRARRSRLLRISSRQLFPRRSIDPSDGWRDAGTFSTCSYRGERPRVPVSAIRSEGKKTREASMPRTGGKGVFLRASCLYILRASSYLCRFCCEFAVLKYNGIRVQAPSKCI